MFPLLGVATWNVGRVYLEGIDSRAGDDDLGRIAAGVAAMDVSVVALQELVSPVQLGRLLALLGDGWQGAIAVSAGWDRRTALLVRTELGPRFELVTSATGRDATAVALGGVAVVAVHLDAFDARRRAAQLDELAAWADGRPEEHVVVAGDFNFDLDHLAFAVSRTDVASAAVIADRFVDLGHHAGPTALLGRRIDYLFARRPGPRPRRAVVHDRLRLPLGDHHPLAALLDVQPNPRRRV